MVRQFIAIAYPPKHGFSSRAAREAKLSCVTLRAVRVRFCKVGVFRVLVLALLLQASVMMASASFSLRGHLTSQVYGNDTNTVVFSAPIAFAVDVDGCRWAISTKLIPDDGLGTLMTFDGKNVYALASTIVGPKTTRSPSAAGLVKREDVPFPCETRADCVWLALASHCYLDREQPGLLSPAWLAIGRTESSLAGDRFRAKIVRLGGKPGLPLKIECWSDGYVADGRQKFRSPEPFQDGSLCLLYQTHSTTNLGDLQIPRSSTVSFLRPRAGTKDPNDCRKIIDVEIIVEDATTPSIRSNWQPALESLTLVEDFRLVDSALNDGSRIYTISDGAWLSESDPRVRTAPRKSGGIPVEGPRKTIVRWYVIGGFVATTLVFAAFVFRSRQSAR